MRLELYVKSTRVRIILGADHDGMAPLKVEGRTRVTSGDVTMARLLVSGRCEWSFGRKSPSKFVEWVRPVRGEHPHES